MMTVFSTGTALGSSHPPTPMTGTRSTVWLKVVIIKYPSDVVIGSGSAGTGLWKWLNVSQFTNSMTEPAITFTVTASNLVQTFQIGARENGLDIDRLVFGNSSYKFTV